MTLSAEELRHLRINMAEWEVWELATQARVPVSAIRATEAGERVLDDEREARVYAEIDARIRALAV